MGNDLDPGKQFEHNDSKHDAEAVINHPRAQGAPSASINDPEYRNAAIERGGGIDDPENPATIEGFPVPVIAKTNHAKDLHERAAHEVATVDQAHRATDLAGDTGLEHDEKVAKHSDPFGGSIDTGSK